MALATLTQDLTKKVTKAESDLATRLEAAALTNDHDEVERLLAHPTIKKLFKRGVLKTSRTVLSFPGDPDLELR
jgi:hypothetical protein